MKDSDFFFFSGGGVRCLEVEGDLICKLGQRKKKDDMGIKELNEMNCA